MPGWVYLLAVSGWLLNGELPVGFSIGVVAEVLVNLSEGNRKPLVA